MDPQPGEDSSEIKGNQRTGASIVAIDAAPLNKRGRGRPPKAPETWVAVFLERYRATGNATGSARAANVSYHTVIKHYRGDPRFAAQMRLAYREYGDMLREKLGRVGIEKDNAIALIASLKGHSQRMAKRFSEKAVDARVLNLQVNNYGAPAALADPAQHLRECLGEITPATRALLAAPSEARPIEEAEIVGGEP